MVDEDGAEYVEDENGNIQYDVISADLEELKAEEQIREVAQEAIERSGGSVMNGSVLKRSVMNGDVSYQLIKEL